MNSSRYYGMPYEELRELARKALEKEAELRSRLRTLRRINVELRVEAAGATGKCSIGGQVAAAKAAAQAARASVIDEYSARISELTEVARQQEDEFQRRIEALVSQKAALQDKLSDLLSQKQLIADELSTVSRQISLLYQQPRSLAAREIKRLIQERASRISDIKLAVSRKTEEIRAEANVSAASTAGDIARKRADVALQIAESKEQLEHLETDAWALNQALKDALKEGAQHEDH